MWTREGVEESGMNGRNGIDGEMAARRGRRYGIMARSGCDLGSLEVGVFFLSLTLSSFVPSVFVRRDRAPLSLWSRDRQLRRARKEHVGLENLGLLALSSTAARSLLPSARARIQYQ